MIGVRQKLRTRVAVSYLYTGARKKAERVILIFVGERCVACLGSHDSITKQRVA
jgi:hypothetical protein